MNGVIIVGMVGFITLVSVIGILCEQQMSSFNMSAVECYKIEHDAAACKILLGR